MILSEHNRTRTFVREPSIRRSSSWKVPCLLLILGVLSCPCDHRHGRRRLGLGQAFVIPRTLSWPKSASRRRGNGGVPSCSSATTTSSCAKTTTSLSAVVVVDGGLLPHDLVLALRDLPHVGALETYGTLLRVYPLVTKSTTAATLAFLGDAIAQYSTILQAKAAEAQRLAREQSLLPPRQRLAPLFQLPQRLVQSMGAGAGAGPTSSSSSSSSPISSWSFQAQSMAAAATATMAQTAQIEDNIVAHVNDDDDQYWEFSYSNQTALSSSLSSSSSSSSTTTTTAETSVSTPASSLSYDWQRGLKFLMFGALYTGAFQHYWFNYLTEHVQSWGEALGIWGAAQVHDVVPVHEFANAADDAAVEWWTYFDVVAQFEQPPSPALLAAAKVAVNQFLVIPLIYMPLFFLFTTTPPSSMTTTTTTNTTTSTTTSDSTLLSSPSSSPRINEYLTAVQQRAQSLYAKLLTRNYVYWLPVQFAQFFAIPTEWQIPFLSSASLVWTVILSSIGTSSGSSTSPSSTASDESTDDTTLPSVTASMLPTWIGDASNRLRDGVLTLDKGLSKQGANPSGVSYEESQLESENDEVSSADITEQVTLEDVKQALIPETLDRIVSDAKITATAAGLTLGLVASSADDAALGEVVSTIVQSDVTGTGVAVVASLGAGIFLLGAMQDEEAAAANAAKQQLEQQQEFDLQHYHDDCDKINNGLVFNAEVDENASADEQS